MQDAAHSRTAPPAAPRPAAEVALIARAREGERDAFEALAVRAMPALLGSARRLLGDRFAAEEAVAEALFRAYRHVASFRGASSFGTWVHRILYRVAADRFRAEARERRRRRAVCERALREAGSDGSTPRWAAPDDRLVQREEHERLRRAVETLPAKQRLVLLLHAWEGLDLQEIGEVLGMRYATAKSNLHHAHRALRTLLGESDAGGRRR